MSPRILVVDDDLKVAAFLRRSLTYEGFAVDVAADGDQALDLATAQRPDAIILDVMMEGLDGFQVCRRLREQDDVPILMLTARDEVADRVRGLDAGADDYLVKPFALEELLARVRALLRRRGAGGPTLKFGEVELNPATWEARRGDRLLQLTVKEFQLLRFFLQRPRRVLTREVLLDGVWGFDFEGDPHVVEVYVGYLRQKLEAGGENRLLHTVRGAGYVLKEA